MFQINLTPSSGKKLIALAVSHYLAANKLLKSKTIVVIAGTTNGYIAEELLKACGYSTFEKKYFFRGITLPPNFSQSKEGRLLEEKNFAGDIILRKGKWEKNKTIFDIIDTLKEGDIILKGANALDLSKKRAAVLIGHPEGGTIASAIKAVIGKRVRLIIPIGLEKRIYDDLDSIANMLNSPNAQGPRFFPVCGEVFTELDAIKTLSGANAKLIAGGGVCGAEGSVWLAIWGTKAQEKKAKKIIDKIINEPPFNL
jgi:hypothetical protein